MATIQLGRTSYMPYRLTEDEETLLESVAFHYSHQELDLLAQALTKKVLNVAGQDNLAVLNTIREALGAKVQEDKKVCPVCHGKGEYLMSGDLHRSEGIVPCRRCGKTGFVAS